ncbi:MAG: hypothetical protein HY952_02280 [Elusimicrobia bacterium]|nr:hypothetical protein [Elusimicrobiota bacterium]
MRKFTFAAAAAALLGGAWGLFYLYRGMGATDVIRGLSGLRMALALYAQEHKGPPASYAEVIRYGKLEEAPLLKLRRHRGASSVKDVPSRQVRDTGGWAYVNVPGSPDFGLVFIDCSHMDEKGRFWSEF